MSDNNGVQQGQEESQETRLEGENEAIGIMDQDTRHPETGLKTSDFYRTKNIPERFNHPGNQPPLNFTTTHLYTYILDVCIVYGTI